MTKDEFEQILDFLKYLDSFPNVDMVRLVCKGGDCGHWCWGMTVPVLCGR